MAGRITAIGGEDGAIDRLEKAGWFKAGGILEGINSLVQAARRKPGACRSDRNFATVIYLIAGKLDSSCQPT